MPPKLNDGGQFAALLIGKSDRLGGGIVDSEHAAILHQSSGKRGRSADASISVYVAFFSDTCRPKSACVPCPALALEPDDPLAGRGRGHSGCAAREADALSEGLRHVRDSAYIPLDFINDCSVILNSPDGDLRGRCRGREEKYCQANLEASEPGKTSDD